MRLEWLEDLVKEGQISATAKEAIYKDCQDMVTSPSFFKGASVRPEVQGLIAHDALNVLMVGLEKNAGFKDKLKGMFGEKVQAALAGGLATVMAGGLVATGAGMVNHFKAKSDQKELADRLEVSFSTAMKESHPENELLRENPVAARKAFETLTHFSPGIATEPRAARSFIHKILSYEDAALHTDDIKGLVDVEKNFQAVANTQSPFFSAFAATGKIVGLDKSIAQGSDAMVSPYMDSYKARARDSMGLKSDLKDQKPFRPSKGY